MAERPVFIATGDLARPVSTRIVQFEWSPGFSAIQKQRSIASLHEASGLGAEILEVSSKSTLQVGRALSAFNLRLRLGSGQESVVESVYQSAKVFDTAGPFPELAERPPAAARAALKPHAEDRLIGFRVNGQCWPLQPLTFFYDWLYCTALRQNPTLVDELTPFRAFTDIEFNPARSFSCQARSVALFLSLERAGQLNAALGDPDKFRTIAYPAASEIETDQQMSLGF